MRTRKGIILAGGSGTRLYPLTIGVSKQLLPVYDKPMIFYPLTVLMLAGITEVLIITTPRDQDQFKRLLADGSQWGLKISFKVQLQPNGLAEAFLLAEDFLDGAPSALILGDNIFFGHGLPEALALATARTHGASVFGYRVSNPETYGVVGFDDDGNVTSLVEKPTNPESNYAVTGLYFVDETAPTRVKKIKPSKRGELEIISLLESYLTEGDLTLEMMGRGFAWFDTGTPNSLIDAGNFVRTLTERQGLQVGSPSEVALNLGLIDAKRLKRYLNDLHPSAYTQHLEQVIKDAQ